MSEFLSAQSFHNSTNNSSQLHRLSVMLNSIMSPVPSVGSGSSGTSSLTSSFSEQEHASSSMGYQDTWMPVDKTSTPRQIWSNGLDRAAETALKEKRAIQLQYSIDVANEVALDRQISYSGRNILDLASNIVPYSWQQKTPLMDRNELATIKILNNRMQEDQRHHEYPMKYCISCGFCQPPAPV